MFNRLKSFALATLVFSLTCSVVSVASDVVVKHTLAQTATTSDRKAEADRLFQEGVQQYRRGEYPKALQTYQRVLEIRRQLGDKTGVGEALNNIGEVYIGLRQHDEALKVLPEALAIRRELKDRKGEGQTLDNIGWANMISGKDDKKTLEVLEQALAIRREVKDRAGEGATLSKLGYTLTFTGQRENGLKLLNDALAIHKEVGDKFQQGLTLFRIAAAYVNTNDKKNYPIALDWFNQALAVNREIGSRAWEARSLEQIATIYYKQENYQKAIEFYEQALPIIREFLNNQLQELSILTQLGVAYSFQNKPEKSIELYQQALEIAKKLEDKPKIAIILTVMASEYSIQGKDEQTIELHLQALTIRREIKDKPAQLESFISLSWQYAMKAMKLQNLGLDAQAKIEYSRLMELGNEALALAKEVKNAEQEAKSLIFIGYAYKFFKDYQKAQISLLNALEISQNKKYLDVEKLALSALASNFGEKGEIRKVISIRKRQIEIAKLENDTDSEAGLLITLGGLYNTLGEYKQAIALFQQAIVKAKEVNISQLPAHRKEYALRLQPDALHGLSLSYDSLLEDKKALDYAEQRLTLLQNINQPKLKAEALIDLGKFYINSEKYQKGIEITQQALKIARQIPDLELEVQALQALSRIYLKQENYSLALESANQALVIAKKLENQDLERSVLGVLIDIYTNQGNHQKALEIAQQVLALTRGSQWEISALRDLSKSYLNIGNTNKAVEVAKEAVTKSRELQNPDQERLALATLSVAYTARGEFEQGVEEAKKSLALSQTNSDSFDRQVLASIAIAVPYEALGEYTNVIRYAEPALVLAKQRKYRPYESELSILLGNAYRIQGDYQKAKVLIEQGLQIARELKNLRLESGGLNALGSLYNSLNQYQKALEFTEKSLKIAQELKVPSLLDSPQLTLAEIYFNLGDYKKSQEYYQGVLATAKQLQNRQSESGTLLLIAYTYFAQGESQKTVNFAQQALKVAQEINIPRFQGLANSMLSIGYGDLGKDKEAMEASQTFLTFARKVQNPVWEKTALHLMGSLHRKFGRKQDAIVAYQTALAIKTDTQVLGGNSSINAGLARTYADLNQVSIAIGYYKDAINGIEQVRRNIEGLPPQLQNSFLQATYDFDGIKVSDIYRQLAELLRQQGRDTEALQVVELLKIQELREFARSGDKKATIPLTRGEQQIKQVESSSIAFGQRVYDCEQQKCPQLKELITQRDNLNREFFNKVNEIEKSIDVKDRNLIYPGDLLKSAESIVKSPRGTIMVYPLVLEDKIVIFWASKGVVVKSLEVKGIGQQQLAITVEKYRKLLQNPSDIASVKATGKELYDWLIKPIETEIKNNKIQNLVFALDRSTRYIPISALFDGEKYLVENYQVSTVIAASLTNLGEPLPPGTENTPVLAVGLSDRVPGFNPLLNVPKELDAIVRGNTKSSTGIYPGLKLLNLAFDFPALQSNLEGKKILHIATHGAFVPNDPNASYLLSGKGVKIPITDIQLLQNLGNLHLVVLSACETALGGSNQNGVEISGISSFFVGLGKAKAAIASLWQVSDDSTSLLMQQFYHNLASGKMTKAEALRQAQLSLLKGTKSQRGDDKKRAGGLIPVAQPENSTQNREATSYEHPYYWAPFILIGNGL